MKFSLIAFDADDTLWHNEPLYTQGKEQFSRLVSKYLNAEFASHRLEKIEIDNVRYYGYGIKSFTLSMIETAIDLAGDSLTSNDILQIIQYSKAMLSADVNLMDYVSETVCGLAKIYDLMVITKGDLLDQESKLARSGLGDCFRYFEVLSEKNTAAYQALLSRYRVDPKHFVMVGNSLKSDILPVLGLGGWAVYVPYPATWSYEWVDGKPEHDRFFELEHLGQLSDLIKHMEYSGNPL